MAYFKVLYHYLLGRSEEFFDKLIDCQLLENTCSLELLLWHPDRREYFDLSETK